MSHEVKTASTSTSENFIETLFQAGKSRLQEKDPSGIELFETISDLAADDALLFHRQGIALFDYATVCHTKTLLLANRKFKRAIKIMPSLFESWVSWANALCVLGLQTQEFHYFLDAKEKFETAISMCEGKASKQIFDLFWNYGLTMARIATQSKDPMDLQQAYRALGKASLAQNDLPSAFFSDFGHIAMRLFSLLGPIKYLHDAICHYTQAENFTELSVALSALYQNSAEPEHFEQANLCFQRADQNDPDTHLQWASLLSSAGRQMQDPKMLFSAMERCQHAKRLDADPLSLYCVWADALQTLGSMQGRLKHLKRAEQMLEPLVENYPHLPHLHFSYGVCLMGLAEYFQCIDMYYQAIESFQKASSLDRTFIAAWHGLANAYQTIANLEDDTENHLRRAIRFFDKALQLRPEPTLHFDLGNALFLLADELTDARVLERALLHIETAISLQKNAPYVYTHWLYVHASALCLAGQLHAQETHFLSALDTLHQLLMTEPTYPKLHYRFALTYNAFADHKDDPSLFAEAFHHFRIAMNHDPDYDDILVDWAVSIIHLYEIEPNESLLAEAERKLMQAARLGNASAHYTLAGLHALKRQFDAAMHQLIKAHKYQALPPLHEVIDDEWLEPLHKLSVFQEFITRVKNSYSEKSS